MNFLCEKLESLVADALESNNEYQFEYILDDLKIDPDLKLKCFDGLSTFEKVLKTPNSRKFIELCLQNGSDYYQKNSDGVFPLRFALESLCADNLSTILKSPEKSTFGSLCDNFDGMHCSMIINEKLVNGNNYLHFLVDHLTADNFDDVSMMLKTMLLNGCNANHPNDQSETPFYCLLKKLHRINNNNIADNDLITFFVDSTSVDFHSHHSDDIINLMEMRGLRHKVFVKKESINDVNFMIQQLDNKDEEQFVQELDDFKSTSRDFPNDIARLLEAAIMKNLSGIVKVLLQIGADVNAISLESKFRMAPAFLTCTFGHHEVLKVLMNDANLSFRCNQLQRSLLQHLLLYRNVHMSDRQKCFDLIVTDRRCSLDVINNPDNEGRTPLFLACHYGYDPIAKELLRRGAFIGHAAVINNIDKEVLREFLDQCVKCTKNISDKQCEVHVDYRFLVPPNVNERSHFEMQSVHLIADNKKLKDLILHPVIASFLELKWKKIDFLVYFNLFVYFCFMMFLGVFITNYFRDSVYNNYGEGQPNISRPPAVGIPYNAQRPPFIASDRANLPLLTTSPPRTTFPFGGLNFQPVTERAEENEDSRDSGLNNRMENESDSSAFHQSSKDRIFKTHRPQLSTTTRTTQQPTTTSKPFKPPSLISLLFGFQPNARSKRSADKTVNNNWDKNFYNHFNENAFSYRLCVVGVALMAIYEIIQCVFSWRNYFFKLSNWLDMTLICLSCIVLLGSFEVQPKDFKRVRAVMILVMAAQSIQLIAKVSVLSMSLHMAIFKRVCGTFLKTIALYLIMILAFAMSFYTLNSEDADDITRKQSSDEYNKFGSDKDDDDDDDDDGGKSFSDPFISVITTVRMMLSDFDTIKIDHNDRFQGLMFLLFVVLITVVLYNLLNALAISDTNNILKDAGLVDTKKRISILHSYEKIFSYFNFSCMNLFPTMATIMLTPNRDHTVKVKSEFKVSNNIVIMIHKPQKYQNIYTRTWKFWIDKQAVRLSSKTMQMIVEFIKTQREQMSTASDNSQVHDELVNLFKELNVLKDSQNLQGETLDNVVRLLCRREKFLEESKTEKFRTIKTDEYFM